MSDKAVVSIAYGSGIFEGREIEVGSERERERDVGFPLLIKENLKYGRVEESWVCSKSKTHICYF